ncbi:small ubiquitin-related modifier domain-containing protein [Aspergillus clavatus NRRL 1]|uniref:Ubiquitin-like domain-containing protein n=1 Tax=Aspergillus clavatus (strain ATCC 1007 / CBS 513.65 / DSM 816 / NCTC 3887 / NRRL 1 / QM 1276 / 107) TaxID=344612 RepID=A1CE20_ASPCL|nr:uncharacterized protein ACLA_088080 [Aspergillus clavatus NRRL 1]EAW11119.1 conserved hypothetical protein [Aspergillus clavatus NRRL 1]
MRSFFKKPSWASRGDENSTSEFYRRAGQVYEDIIIANKEARENSIRCSSETFTNRGRAKKRRRLSDEGIPQGNTPPESDDQPRHIPEPRDGQEVVLLTYRTHSSGVSGEGSSGSEQQVGKKATRDASTTNQANHTGLECERVLVSPCLQELDIGSPSCIGSCISAGRSVQQYGDNLQMTPKSDSAQCSDPKDKDVIVQILITSQLAKTKPLIIHRRMSQSLRDVRLAWCKHQNLSAEVQASIYLTWKGRRLFDVTTCKSLGLTTETNPFEGDDEMSDCIPIDSRHMRVHMEAITEELVAQNVRSLSTMAHSQLMEPTPGQASLTRIIMKCPGYENLEMEVDSNARVSQLMKAFRHANSIAAEQDIYLVFDGDRLSPDSRLADYEITDDDLIDVLIR